MSSQLFDYFLHGEVDKFRALLAPAGRSAYPVSRGYNSGGGGGGGGSTGSPGAFATSPQAVTRTRKALGGTSGARYGASGLGKSEINFRDDKGATVLLLAASSTAENAIEFVEALLEHPVTDLYATDHENGWNCLHRALYFGNISIARLLLDKERRNLSGETIGASFSKVGQLIKTKDYEGNSPFDLFNSTIGERLDAEEEEQEYLEDDKDDGANWRSRFIKEFNISDLCDPPVTEEGEELFTFGSNKNLTLGLGDQDDRQFPERVILKRPDHLLTRWHQEYLDKTDQDLTASSDISTIPALIQSRPLFIRDVVLSKLHSAVLTSDPMSNLYICGIGRGGRLGLGDENTRFTYACVQGGLAGKEVAQVALGQNHSMALTMNGELWTWGSNASSQLGYVLPAPAKPDEDPMSTLPTRVFGPLKKEIVLGIAASAIHSVAHTGSALYCWGKNVGQLGLMDSDSRSLEVQQTPRRVAASLLQSNIAQVAAIDKATICLLRNHTVVCFTSYGYTIVKFPPVEIAGGAGLSYYTPRTVVAGNADRFRNKIVKITASGETMAGVSSQGELFTFGVNQKADDDATAMSTTNPSKIRTSITTPQCIWNAKQDGVKSVSIGEHGSVIISTTSGAVWRRVKRAKAKDAYVTSSSGSRLSQYKFQRVPGITNVVRVAASPFGAFAAIRRDLAMMRTKIRVGKQTIWDDVASLNPLAEFRSSEPSEDSTASDIWANQAIKERLAPIAFEVLKSPDIESDLQRYLRNWSYGNTPLDAAICTTSSSELVIPVHGWLLSARSPVLRQAFARFRKDGSSSSSETFSIDNVGGRTVVTFVGLDIISILNLVLYTYTDEAIPAWNFSRAAPPMAYRYRQVRAELMKVSSHLKMMTLEKAVRMQSAQPEKVLPQDFDDAFHARGFLDDGDVLLELDGDAIPAHSSLLCQRCPWFESMFHGRSGGRWLAHRRENLSEGDRIKIDLKHIDPDVFRHVLRHIYADTGDEMFDEIVSPTVDDFTDLIMDVMDVANELMLDRLAQVCQKMMGHFVNTRNIAVLLNVISPCAVKEFKDAGLEYICLQMETMLENHLLDELDPELMEELDEVVRANQLAQQPYVRSGRAELLLIESNPWLREEIEEGRRTQVKEMARKAAQKDGEKKPASSAARTRYGSLDDSFTPPPADRPRQVSMAARNEPFSPDLRPKQSQNDLMFDMEDEDTSVMDSPSAKASRRADMRQLSASQGAAASPSADLAASPHLAQSQRAVPVFGTPKGEHSARTGAPWKASPLPTAKLDLRDVFKPASPASPSGISAGLAAQKMRDSSAPKPTPPKLSQKERKKQQQAQAAEAAVLAASSQSPKPAWDKSAQDQPSPWKIASAKGKSPATTTPTGSITQASAVPKPLVAAESSTHVSRRTASPDTRFSGQSRTPSSSNISALRPPVRGSTPVASSSLPKPPPPAAPSSSITQQQPKPLVPHSKSYITRPPKDEPLLGLSIADIIEHEQRERQVVKEAVAKRSLQEIQQEQEFQQWWEAESLRTQLEDEARRGEGQSKSKGKDKDEGGGASSGKRGGRRGGRGGKGTSARGGGGGGAGPSTTTSTTPATRQEGPGDGQSGGRGKGRRGRGGGGPTAV